MTLRVGKLARRRGEVVTLMLSGLSQSQVARRLDVSRSTVSRDVARIRIVVNAGSCRDALEEVIPSYDKSKDGDTAWPAQRAALRALATAVDDDPSSPSMWREYRTAMEEWLSGDEDPAWKQVVEALRGDMPAEVRDA